MQDRKWTVPNVLTGGRIIAVTVVAALLTGWWGAAVTWWTTICALFVVAFVTDLLDGEIARRLRQESKFGAWLDPVADKLAVIVGFASIAVLGLAGGFEFFCFSVIAFREGAVSLLRSRMGSASVPVSKVAQYKTFVQMVAILVYHPLVPFPGTELLLIAQLLLAIATGLTLWSGRGYWLVYRAHKYKSGRVQAQAAE